MSMAGCLADDDESTFHYKSFTLTVKAAAW